MNPASLLKNNQTQELINTMIRSNLFASYARITGISKTDPLSVTVECCVGKNGFAQAFPARVLYPTTAFIQVAFKPMIGDKVLVIGLQAYSKNMFESPVTLTENEVNDVQHYTILGCVAVPLNIESAKAPIKVSNDATAITIGREATPGTDPVVRWSELKAVLQDLWKAYNFHLHPGEVTGPPTKQWLVGEDPPDPTGAPSFADLASDILKVTPSTGV